MTSSERESVLTAVMLLPGSMAVTRSSVESHVQVLLRGRQYSGAPAPSTTVPARMAPPSPWLPR